jgi:hypothetical protein
MNTVIRVCAGSYSRKPFNNILVYNSKLYKIVQDKNSSQTPQFYYTITFKATCFDSIETSLGLLENRSNVSTFIVHSGIPEAYNRWYSPYKSTRVTDMIIYTIKGKGKAIPLQAWTGLEGSRRLRLPDFKTADT